MRICFNGLCFATKRPASDEDCVPQTQETSATSTVIQNNCHNNHHLTNKPFDGCSINALDPPIKHTENNSVINTISGNFKSYIQTTSPASTNYQAINRSLSFKSIKSENCTKEDFGPKSIQSSESKTTTGNTKIEPGSDTSKMQQESNTNMQMHPELIIVNNNNNPPVPDMIQQTTAPPQPLNYLQQQAQQHLQLQNYQQQLQLELQQQQQQQEQQQQLYQALFSQMPQQQPQTANQQQVQLAQPQIQQQQPQPQPQMMLNLQSPAVPQQVPQVQPTQQSVPLNDYNKSLLLAGEQIQGLCLADEANMNTILVNNIVPTTLQEQQFLHIIRAKDLKIQELEMVLRNKENEIAELKSHLDKFQSVFPFSRSPGGGGPVAVPGAGNAVRKTGHVFQRQRAQGISAEPQSESSVLELLNVTFPKYDKDER